MYIDTYYHMCLSNDMTAMQIKPLRPDHAVTGSIDTSRRTSGELVLDECERRRANLDRVALVHGELVAIAPERVRSIAVQLHVGRQLAMEAS